MFCPCWCIDRQHMHTVVLLAGFISASALSPAPTNTAFVGSGPYNWISSLHTNGFIRRQHAVFSSTFAESKRNDYLGRRAHVRLLKREF